MNQWFPDDELYTKSPFHGLEREMTPEQKAAFFNPPQRTWSERLARRWLNARRWIAWKILRVSVE